MTRLDGEALMFAKNVRRRLRKSARRAIFVQKTPRRAVNARPSRCGKYTGESDGRTESAPSHRSYSNYGYISSWEIRPRFHVVVVAPIRSAARCQTGTLTTPTTLCTVAFKNCGETQPTSSFRGVARSDKVG